MTSVCIVFSVCDTYTWSIILPLSCVGLLIICFKPCNLNIVQQQVFDVTDTSLFKSPTTHIGVKVQDGWLVYSPMLIPRQLRFSLYSGAVITEGQV